MPTVADILRKKGSSVYTVSPDYSLHLASRSLKELRIGALVVIDDEQNILGIISERDIVGCLAEHGAGAAAKKVHNAMTKVVKTCEPSNTIGEIMEQMTSGRFRHVPVLKDGKLAGIVSIGDIVKERLAEMANETDALRDYIQTA